MLHFVHQMKKNFLQILTMRLHTVLAFVVFLFISYAAIARKVDFPHAIRKYNVIELPEKDNLLALNEHKKYSINFNTGPTIYVDGNNAAATDTRTGLSNYAEDVPFKSITAALTAALSNDVIYVRSGTYNEAINLVNTNRNLNIIYDNVTQIAGATSALMLTTLNYSTINLTLINSTISNTGNAADRIGSSTIYVTQTNNNFTITGVGSSSISSQEGTAVSLTTNTGGGNLYLNGLNLSSVNSIILNTPTPNEGVSIVNCNLTSTNSAALTKATWLYLNNSSINTYSTSISGVLWAYLTIINSSITSSHGNGINANTNTYYSNWNAFTRIENSNIYAYSEAIFINVGNAAMNNYGKIRNCYFEISNPTTLNTLNWSGDTGAGTVGSGSESMWECTNNKSNKPLAYPSLTHINVRNQFFTLVDHSVATNESNVEINNRGNTTIGSPLVLNNTLTLNNKSADPSSSTNGTMYYNTTSNTIKGFQNGSWKNILTDADVASVTSSTWGLSGNDVVNESNNFIGTKSAQSLIFKTSSTEALRITAQGNIAIGTTDPKGYRLAVNGDALFTKVKVKSYGTWPDYVFNKNYKLASLIEIEKYIELHKHLPGVPSAKQIESDGIDVASQQTTLLQKVEELTLYIIELNKKVNVLEWKNEELKRRISKLNKSSK